MKRTLFSLLLISLFGLPFSELHSQSFQLLNAGFEQWDGGSGSEPTHWNTFESSDGTYASMASDNHHYRRAGHRTGGSGSYYLTIYTKSIMGVKANGNMTTGRIHAGSMSAGSSSNYNYTQRSNSDHSQPFTATPDSMYLWVSFYAGSGSSTAQVEAVIHGDNDFKTPNNLDDSQLYAGYAVAQTTRTTTSSSQMSWQQLKVPFVYDGTAQPAYILVSITTNKNPGGGDKNDSLSIDDIEFIYSAWLTNISIDGNTVEGFNKGRFNYEVHVDDLASISVDNVSYTTEAGDATVEKTFAEIDDTTLCVTLTVTAEDGTTQKTYNIFATTGTPSTLTIHNSLYTTHNSLFPNPARDYLTVNCNGTIELVDMKGRTVLRKQCSNGERIDINSLPRGLYTAIINGKKERIVIL